MSSPVGQAPRLPSPGLFNPSRRALSFDLEDRPAPRLLASCRGLTDRGCRVMGGASHFLEIPMARKTGRLRAALKAKFRKQRARKAGLLTKKRNGGRLTSTPRGKDKKTVYVG